MRVRQEGFSNKYFPALSTHISIRLLIVIWNLKIYF